MEIRGTLHTEKNKSYGFEITNNRVTRNGNKLQVCFFEQDVARYFHYQFIVEFKDVEDFVEQYTGKEKNLFRYFFNDDTIDFDSLEFLLSKRDIEEIKDRNGFRQAYPVINSLFDDESWYDVYYNVIEDDFNYWCNEERFDQCLERIDCFYDDGYYLLDNLVGTMKIRNLTIENIQALNENDELDDFLTVYREINGLSEKEKWYINLACNFDSDEFVKMI